MKRPRFSIAGLMGFVLIAGLGLGGLKGADGPWASACYTLMIATLILAILNAAQSRGKDRAYWAGFAVAGWFYFGVVFGAMGPYRVTSPPMLTELLFDRLEPLIHPPTAVSITTAILTPTPVAPTAPPTTLLGTSASSTWTEVVAAPQPATISVGSPSASTAFFSSAFFTPTTAALTRVHYSQVAHSLTALLIGMLGGFYSLWMFARRERRKADPKIPEVARAV